MRICGSVKAVSSLVAYFPQMYNNYTNKTTFGFSLKAIFMDLFGGAIAIVQIGIDYCRVPESHGFFHDLNYGKFLLNGFSILACVVFMVQHYCIYGNKRRSVGSEVLIIGNEMGQEKKVVVFDEEKVSEETGETKTNTKLGSDHWISDVRE